MESSPEGRNGRFELEEERLSKLEDKAISEYLDKETIQSIKNRKKKE